MSSGLAGTGLDFFKAQVLKRNLTTWESVKSRNGRSAPASGYDHYHKVLYRFWAWRQIASPLGHWTGRRGHHVLLMPSLEGSEISEHALDKHFSQDHLHVVDKNPAIVATLKKRYPHINTYGVDVARAHKRIATKGVRLSAAHMDLCSPGGWRLAATVAECAQSGAWGDGAVIVVNMLRGRESRRDTVHQGAGAIEHPARYYWAYSPTDADYWRIWRICSSVTTHTLLPECAYKYKSTSNQTFLGVAFRAIEHDYPRLPGVGPRVRFRESERWFEVDSDYVATFHIDRHLEWMAGMERAQAPSSEEEEAA